MLSEMGQRMSESSPQKIFLGERKKTMLREEFKNKRDAILQQEEDKFAGIDLNQVANEHIGEGTMDRLNPKLIVPEEDGATRDERRRKNKRDQLPEIGSEKNEFKSPFDVKQYLKKRKEKRQA